MKHKKQLDNALNQVEPELTEDDLSMLSHAKAMETADNPSSQMEHQINLISSLKGNIFHMYSAPYFFLFYADPTYFLFFLPTIF